MQDNNITVNDEASNVAPVQGVSSDNLTPSEVLPDFSIKDLFDASFHIGHKTRYLHPKATNYIYGSQDKIHIINLARTNFLLKNALQKIKDVASSYGKILFVGTKNQAKKIVLDEAERCGQYHVTNRWLGGIMTNWPTISLSIRNMVKMRKIIDDEEFDITKKERLKMIKDHNKLYVNLNGIEKMRGLPKLLIVFDVNKSKIAVKEAQIMNVPVVALIDSNSDPTGVRYPVPGNDDSMRSISLFARLCADSVILGMKSAIARSNNKKKTTKKNDDSKHPHSIKKIKQMDKK